MSTRWLASGEVAGREVSVRPEAEFVEQSWLIEGRLLADAGAHERAIDVYSEALTELPSSVDLLYARAMAATGDWDLLRVRVPGLRDVVAVVVGVLVILLAAAGIQQLLTVFQVEVAQNQVITTGQSDPTYFLYMIPVSLLFVGPFEELVFRAGLLGLLSLIASVFEGPRRLLSYFVCLPLSAAVFAIATGETAESAAGAIEAIFNVIIVVIAAMALIVGGIGIMNIMLASVMERIKEIGLRRSIGATRRDVELQFLIEAISISFTGGVIGILLGVLISVGIEMGTGIVTIVSPGSVALAFLVSVSVGLVFGLLPARRAAEHDPVVALRHE